MLNDIAWAAGFIDGEGCITITKSSRDSRWHIYSVCLSVTQREREPLDKLSELFGGKVALRKSGKFTYYNWRLFGANAGKTIAIVRPYLHTNKRQQADIVVDEFLPLVGTQGVRRTEQTVSKMEALYKNLLNIRAEATKVARLRDGMYHA